MKKRLCFIVLASISLCAHAQLTYDRSDFEGINQAYARLTTLQTEVDYVYYPSHQGKKAGETLRATLSLDDGSYHYRLQEVETLCTPAFTILVDHEEKQIMLDSTRRSLRQVLFGADLDAVLSVCAKIRFSYPEPGIKKYELYATLGETERIDIYFDTTTFLMRRVVLFYNRPLSAEEGGTGEKPRLELVYRRQDAHPTFDKDLFSPARLIKKSGNRYAPVPALRGYKISDYVSK
ncbi:MAG: hypothetical protein ABMA02_15060 [Saprospiraceae bacterium]